MRRKRTPWLAKLFILFTPAVAATDGPRLIEASPVPSGEPRVVLVDWDRNALHSASKSLTSVRIEDLGLAEDLTVDLEIEPFSVTSERTRFVLGRRESPDEILDFDPSTIALFKGRVPGFVGSRIFLASSDHGTTGFIHLGSGHSPYRFASKDGAGRDLPAHQVAIYPAEPGGSTRQALPPGIPHCGVQDEEPLDARLDTLPTIGGKGMPTTVGLKHLELAVETDLEFFQLFESSEAAAAYLVMLYAEVSVIFQRDVDVWVDLVFARIWDEPDPFDGPDPLPEFRDYWTTNMGSVERDVAQLFSGRRNYPFGGQAFLSVLCDSDFGYSVAGYAMGLLPDPSRPSPYHYDLQVTTHELGHTAGTGHTHSQGIDDCNDPFTIPQRGTIMAYCGQTFMGQNANRDSYLHRLIQENIDNHIAESACVVDDCNRNGVADALDIAGDSLDANGNGVPDECEDCNDNGVLDNLDIQGGSADVDGNGVPDECEPDCNNNDRPDALDIAEGTSTDAYGNDIPDECEADCNTNDVSDFTEIQLDMSLDVDRNAILDTCQACDGDTNDLDALGGAHGLWMGTGENAEIRRFYASTGVLDALGTELVDEVQDVLVTADGRVLVSSAPGDRVLEFDTDGTYVGDLISAGTGGLDHPTGLLLLDGGTLLVASRNTHNVLAFDLSSGASLGAFVGSGSGGLTAPFGLTRDRLGDLYVTSDDNRVLRYDGTNGTFLGVFVSAAANGGLDQPRGMTFKGDGNLLVSSLGTDEVLEYDGTDGTPLGKWAQVGTASVLTQTHPWGIRVGPNGNVFVARTGEDHHHGFATEPLHLTDAAIYEFDVANGNFLRTHIGGAGHGLEFPTAFDFIPGWQVDCNLNLLPDSCDIDSGTSLDLDDNGIPDECEVDCNNNGVLDRLDIIPFGSSFDVDANLIPDECNDGLFSDGFESGDTSTWSG